MELPYSVNLASSVSGWNPSNELMEMFTSEVNEFLTDKYDCCNNGWCYGIVISDIDWDKSEKSRYNELAQQYALSAKMYFDILKIALYKCEGIDARTSTDVVKNMPANNSEVYKFACKLLEFMYGGNE